MTEQVLTRHLTKYPSGEVEMMSATIGEHHVLYMVNASGQNTDGLSINGTFFADRDEDDLFCSELFGALVGMYPHEFREVVPPTRMRPR